MGDNIPGKPREALIYLGGVPTYYKTIGECAANGYQGFKLGKGDEDVVRTDSAAPRRG